MKMPTPPIEEPVRREAKRKITLIELLGAFDEARKEAEEYQVLDQQRRQERLRLAAKARKAMKGAAHEDHLEDDVVSVWKRIQQCPKKIIGFSDLCQSDDPDERIKTFLSILFLMYDKKIRVFQRQFPYGKIFIKNIGYT
jgi:chromatin segregation and condensation protein Rec8/ScpA/Scc1 (kleisin family)